MTIASHGELELYRGEQSPDSRGHLEAPISEGHKGDGLGLLAEKNKETPEWREQQRKRHKPLYLRHTSQNTPSSVASSHITSSSLDSGNSSRRSISKAPLPRLGSLVRIELVNFKSYAGKQVIGPFSDFTCVIGPNGAGKSNILDACAFALGVQTRHLRGTKLVDMVYRGPNCLTDLRASVTLVYSVGEGEVKDKAAGEEIHFRRTILGGGGSTEYSLGGGSSPFRVVPWSEYEAVLRGIGILVKARNFLVFQGDVEGVAQKSPHELTMLFEQISGSDALIEEYEAARREMELAEENTILRHQERKTAQAERKQAKEERDEAMEYAERVKELEDVCCEYYLAQLFHIDREIKERTIDVERLGKEQTAAEKTEQQANDELKRQKRDLAKVCRTMAKREIERGEARKAKADAKAAIARHCVEIKALHAQVERGEERVEAVSNDKEAQRKNVKNLEVEIQQLREKDQVEENKKKSGVTKGGATGLNSQDLEEYQRLKAKSRIETKMARETAESARAKETENRSEFYTLDKELCELEARKKSQENMADQYGKRHEAMLKAANIAETEQAEVEAELKSIVGAQESGKLRAAEIEKELKCVADELRDEKDYRQRTKKEAKMAECRETLKSLFPGVRGRLVDLCRPSQRKYDTAVTVAAGRWMDAIVVDTKQACISCIQYMRDQRVGTASFIPLSSIQVKPVMERLRGIGSRYRLCLDVIQCEPEVRKAVQFAVANTVIADTLTDARELCFQRGERVKCVTQCGSLISKNGNMTGGSSSGGGGRGRGGSTKSRFEAANFELLKKKKADLEAEMLSISRAHRSNASAATVANAESELDAAEDIVFAEFNASIGVNHIREFESGHLKDVQSLMKKRLKLREHISKLEAQLEYERSRDFEKPLEKLRATLIDRKTKFNELELERTRLMNQIDTLTKRVTDAQSKLTASQADVAEKENDVKKIHEEKAKHTKDKAEKGKRVTVEEGALERLRARLHQVLQKARVEEVQLPMKKNQGGGDMSEDDDEESECSSKDPSGEQESNDEGTSAASKRFSQSDSKTVCQDEAAASRIDLSKLKSHRRIEGGGAKLETILSGYVTRMGEMKTALDRLQPNLRATKNYGTVSNKFAMLGATLETAKERSHAAHEAFRGIKEKRQKVFMTAFSRVDNALKQVYAELTRTALLSGSAYLSLQDPEEPYLGGISFTAMPPTKRWRSMDQLSGGEKTVAALSLLFALHAYRPAPFFMLDEVDAALDKVNIAKVCQYIRSRSRGGKLQSVVISLKDDFYDKADALVGVYRDVGGGGSKAATLDLQAFSSEESQEVAQ
eukprot:126066_1